MKKHLSASFVLLLIILSYACVPRFESNTRLLTVGNIEDQNGTPLSDIDVTVYTQVYSSYGFFFFVSATEDEFELGSGHSKNDGTFSIISLFDKDDDFTIALKGDSTYTDYFYATSTANFAEDDLTFDLGTISLKKLANFELLINRVSPVGTELNVNLTYQFPKCLEFYEDGNLIEEQSSCYENRVVNLNFPPNESGFSQTYETFLASTVTISYSIDGASEISETFSIDQDNYSYEINY